MRRPTGREALETLAGLLVVCGVGAWLSHGSTPVAASGSGAATPVAASSGVSSSPQLNESCYLAYGLGQVSGGGPFISATAAGWWVISTTRTDMTFPAGWTGGTAEVGSGYTWSVVQGTVAQMAAAGPAPGQGLVVGPFATQQEAQQAASRETPTGLTSADSNTDVYPGVRYQAAIAVKVTNTTSAQVPAVAVQVVLDDAAGDQIASDSIGLPVQAVGPGNTIWAETSVLNEAISGVTDSASASGLWTSGTSCLIAGRS